MENQNDDDSGDITVIKYGKRGKRKTMKSLMVKKPVHHLKNNDLNSLNLSSSKSKAYIPDVELEKKINNDFSKIDSSSEEKTVTKVRMNRACIYLWFCFVRRRKIMENYLLNEGMDIISQRLDIFNIFEKVYKAEQRNEPLTNKIFSMSNECKKGIKMIQLET